jgi:hypothetical protein
MGREHVPSRLSAIVRPDPRWELWEDETGIFDAGGTKIGDIGQASAHAGVAIPDQDTDLGLRASGDLSKPLEVLCNRAGLPVLDEFGYLVRDEGGQPADWMGCDLPVPLGGHQSVTQDDQRVYPHVISVGPGIDDVAALCVYQDAAGAIYSRTVYDRAPWDSEVTIDSTAAAPAYPCLLRLPSGRVLCYRWADDGGDYQIRAWYTDDNGTTWTQIGPVLDEAIKSADYTDRVRIRAVYHRPSGVIGLFAHVRAADSGVGIWRDRVAQWASSDGGYHFEQVTISDGTDSEHMGGYIDVCEWRGEIVLARLAWDGSTAHPNGIECRIRRLPSPWYPWTSGEELAVTSTITSGDNVGTWVAPVPATSDGRLTEGECALWVDDDTALYLSLRQCVGAYDGSSAILRSPDGGKTWLAPGTSAPFAGRGQVWHDNGAAATEAYGFTACAIHGHSCTVYSTESSEVGSDRLYSMWLGGFQDVPMPSVSQVIDPVRRTAWDHVGAATHLPSECGWTRNVVGAPTETIGGAQLYHATGAGERIYYNITPPGTLAQGVLCEHAVEVESGQANIRILLQDGTPQDFDAEVRVSPTAISLFDNNAGAIVGSALAYSGGPVAIRISMEGDQIVAFAHAPGDKIALANAAELCGQSRDWTEIARSPGLAAGGGAAANLIEFETTASSIATWFWWPFSSGAYCGDHLYNQAIRTKFPRSIVQAPSSAIKGAKLASASGPGVNGDTWTIQASADYRYDRVLPTYDSSPQHSWRSDTFASVFAGGSWFRLAFKLADVDEYMASPLLVVLLDGISFGGAELWLEYGGAWAKAHDVGHWDCVCSRKGSTLEVTAASPSLPQQIRRDELVGCLVEYITGGGGEEQVDYQHRIVRNEPGVIDTSKPSVPLRFEVDSHVAGEPANPIVRIYPRRALAVIDLDSYATAISGIAVRAPANKLIINTPPPKWPPEGYVELSTLAAGGAWVIGTRHGWGRRLGIESATELLTAEDGTRTSYERGPARRRWSQTWADPVVMLDLDGYTPDYTAFTSSGSPLNMRYYTPQDLQDILRSLAGSGTVVVWCEALDGGGTGATTRWADGAALARITGAVDRDLVVGDEERDPVERVQDLTFEEEL